MKLFWISAVIVALTACGGEKPGPSVGGNNGDDDNNGVADTGTASNNGQTIAPLDMGAPDTGTPAPDMAAPEDMNAPVDLGMPEDIGVTPDMAPDMGSACPARPGAMGDPCNCDEQCSSDVCVDAEPGKAGFCSKNCLSRAECAQGAQNCVPEAGAGVSYCRPDDTGAGCTTNMVSDPSRCSATLCVEAGSNHNPRHYCSIECERASDCRMGHACSPMRCKPEVSGWSCIPTVVAQRAGTNKDQVLMAYPMDRNLCVPMGAANSCNVQTDQLACASGMCDANSSNGPRCTAQCLDALDCPAGGCRDVDVRDPALPIRECDLP